MQQLIKLASQQKALDTVAAESTLLVDEQGNEHGILYFVSLNGKKHKVMLPAPFHKDWKDKAIKIKDLLNSREAMLLK